MSSMCLSSRPTPPAKLPMETHIGWKQRCGPHDDRCGCEHLSDRSLSKCHWSRSRSRDRSHNRSSQCRSPYRSNEVHHEKSPDAGSKSICQMTLTVSKQTFFWHFPNKFL